MLLGTLGDSLLEDMFVGNGVVRAGPVSKNGKGIVSTRYGK